MNTTSTWTQFWDMHSGGGNKEHWNFIYIEAPQDEAEIVFYNRFGHNPNRVSCTCCGRDYSIYEGTLPQLTAYHRGCDYDTELNVYIERPNPSPCNGLMRSFDSGYYTLEQYLTMPDVLVIPASDIKPEEREGELPEQGYVWKD